MHYHRLVLGAVPDGCARALDIGCGDGLLARKLARRIPEVTGVPAARLLARRHGGMSAPSGMPIQDADMTWGEIRRAARDMLPGSRFRRHLLWRYALMWDKPRS